jgi:hypothetical protein
MYDKSIDKDVVICPECGCTLSNLLAGGFDCKLCIWCKRIWRIKV